MQIAHLQGVSAAQGAAGCARQHRCRRSLQAACLQPRRRQPCQVLAYGADGPKTGVVGPSRFQEGALPGTYYGSSSEATEKITVNFQTDAPQPLSIEVPAGSNLLKAAEQAGAMKLHRDFCFEGTCELCQLEVVGGAQELGNKAQPGHQELVRGCIAAVPCSRAGVVDVKVLSDESVWAEGVL